MSWSRCLLLFTFLPFRLYFKAFLTLLDPVTFILCYVLFFVVTFILISLLFPLFVLKGYVRPLFVFSYFLYFFYFFVFRLNCVNFLSIITNTVRYFLTCYDLYTYHYPTICTYFTIDCFFYYVNAVIAKQIK